MRRLLRLVPMLACALGLSFINVGAQEKPNASQKPQKIVKEGIEIEFTVEPAAPQSKTDALMAGREAVFRFKIHDTATKTPMSGAKPAAWVAQRDRSGPPGPDQCRAKIQAFLQGSLRARPDVDLNAFYLLALNQQPNISVIDPLIGFGGSRLLTLILLKSPGEDWALTSDRSKLFVSMPLVNQVAVVDTTSWKVIADVETGVKPTRLVLQPDEKYLWVGDAAGVTVIDTVTLKVAKQIATGAGHHDISFGAENRSAFITNSDDGTLSVVDVRKLKKLKDVNTGKPASSLTFSPLSKALYVTNEVDGRVAVIDSGTHKLLAHIPTKPGIKSVRFSPGGRWGFVPNPVTSTVFIFDASTNRLAHEQAVGEGPDQVAFSDTFAYVRSLHTDQVSAIRLSTIGNQVDVVKFPGGQKSPGSVSGFAASADAFVPAPEPGVMLITNPADKMVYYYSEGMAAPMGNFQNYRRVPRAVKVVDRSLREEERGVYSTTARLPKEGVYNVSLLLDSPRVTHCFEAVARSNPEINPVEKTALRIEYLDKESPFITGEHRKIRFRLTDRKTRKPKSRINDVGVLVFLSPGMWQTRQVARSLGDGIYEVNVNIPETGVYLVFVESPSQRVEYRELPYLMFHANAPRQSAAERDK